MQLMTTYQERTLMFSRTLSDRSPPAQKNYEVLPVWMSAMATYITRINQNWILYSADLYPYEWHNNLLSADWLGVSKWRKDLEVETHKHRGDGRKSPVQVLQLGPEWHQQSFWAQKYVRTIKSNCNYDMLVGFPRKLQMELTKRSLERKIEAWDWWDSETNDSQIIVIYWSYVHPASHEVFVC